MSIDYDMLIGDSQVDGSIRNLSNRNNVPSRLFLTEAQQWIWERLRTRAMLQTVTGTLAIGASTITLPTNYRRSLMLRFTGSATSLPKHRRLDDVIASFSYDGDGNLASGFPNQWATDDTDIVFHCKAAEACPYLFTYYGALADLAPDNKTNVLTTRHFGLLKAVCLSKAHEYGRDDKQMVYWLKIAMGEIDDINTRSDEELMGIESDVDIGGDF